MYATIYSTVIIIYILFQILRIVSQSWKEMKMASTVGKKVSNYKIEKLNTCILVLFLARLIFSVL